MHLKGGKLHHFMENRRGKVEALSDFIFLGFKITADGNCSHEMKRPLLPGRKAMIKLDRDITLPTKVCIVKAMFSPAVMYRCKHVTIKKAECQRTDMFELWCWRRLLGVPWTARRSNQSILKEINPEYSLEGLMLELKLQYFGHVMRRANSLEKTCCWERLRAEEAGNRGWDGWMASPTPGSYTNSCPSISDVFQPYHFLSSPPPLTFKLSQHQGLFQWVNTSHQVAKVLELQLQHQSFQWIFRTDFL